MQVLQSGKADKKELYPDGFGFFPLEFKPGRLAKFSGKTSFTIEADAVTLYNKNQNLKVSFSEIDEIEESADAILIHHNQKQTKIYVSADISSRLIELLTRLVDEYKAYNETLNHRYFNMDWYHNFFKCLTFRAKPFVWAANLLLKKSVEVNVTDVHFEPTDNKTKISFRIDDEIITPLPIDSYYADRLSSRLKYLAGCQSHISNKPQEGAFKDEETGIDVRLSAFPAESGERISLRFIDTIKFTTLESLNWPKDVVKQWRQLITSENNGLYLITGPVGSGKTTAMYSTLSEIASSGKNSRVVTIEDPVEGRIPEICQSSLEKMKNVSLADAFKYLLRQDPDVIALGEIRDKECLLEALQASLSGHMVFATFHAGSSDEAVLRIKQMGIDEYMVLSGLKAILELDLKRSKDFVEPVIRINSEHIKSSKCNEEVG